MLGAVTEIDESVADVVVTVFVPDFEPKVAVIVADPGDIPVNQPCVPVALLTIATPLLELDQVTEFVRLTAVLSLYKPIAVACWPAPTARDVDGTET